MTPPVEDELARFEAHVQLRLEAIKHDLERSEERLLQRILVNTDRLTSLEGWRHEMVGAAKISRVIWVALLAIGAAAWQLMLWMLGHPSAGGSR